MLALAGEKAAILPGGLRLVKGVPLRGTHPNGILYPPPFVANATSWWGLLKSRPLRGLLPDEIAHQPVG